MTKYRNQDRIAAEEAELEELEREFAAQSGTVTPPAEETPVVDELPTLSKEEETWKKRHSDLRSYTAKQMNQLQEELTTLKKALADKEKENSKLPVNKAEAEEWVKEYPDLARVLGTLIDERAGSQVQSVSDEVRDVRTQLEAEREAVARERAFNEILKVHPDFGTLIDDEDFKAWVEEQPEERGPLVGQALYDALYKNSSDAKSAIQAINVYKSDKNAKKPKKDTSREAAASIPVRTAPSTPTGNGKRTFTESEIERMSSRDFDKYEEEIEEARRDGRIVYDQTAAAR
jgi:hypothetical protein